LRVPAAILGGASSRMPMRPFPPFRRTVLLAALGVLAACADLEKPAAVQEGPGCAADLAAQGAVFERMNDRTGPNGCRLRDAVRLTRSTVALDQPVQFNCETARHLLRFERDVVQPAAQRHFGQPLARIRHFGGYACRGRADGARQLSEHALGNAIDIAGFDLGDGTQITVGRHWNDPGPRGAFLKDVARGACTVFHLVLTPRTDALHRSHFHLDIGRWRRCDA
jgi:hypothetical protein